jgi:hypothetical protein
MSVFFTTIKKNHQKNQQKTKKKNKTREFKILANNIS